MEILSRAHNFPEMFHDMGWSPAAYWMFVISNVVIALSYYWIGASHIRQCIKEYTLYHLQYGAFIYICGTAHMVMAFHMIHPVVVALTAVHFLTALVSAYVIYRHTPNPCEEE